jgi:hypothetical protein
MDPRDRADAALARARARGAFVVTPEDAVSPMDAANTLQIPRSVVDAADANRDQPDSTMVISAGMARGDVQPEPIQQHQPVQQQPIQQQPPLPPPQQHQPQPQHNQHRAGAYQSGPHQPVPNPGQFPPQNGQQQRPPQQGGQQRNGQTQAGHAQNGHPQNGQHQSGHYQQVPVPQAVTQPAPNRAEQAPQQRQPEPEEQPAPRQLDGLVPTVQHPGTQRSLLSRRLDGQ